MSFELNAPYRDVRPIANHVAYTNRPVSRFIAKNPHLRLRVAQLGESRLNGVSDAGQLRRICRLTQSWSQRFVVEKFADLCGREQPRAGVFYFCEVGQFGDAENEPHTLPDGVVGR